MGLRGCISIDRLPLQILLKDNPAWAGDACRGDERGEAAEPDPRPESRGPGKGAGRRHAVRERPFSRSEPAGPSGAGRPDRGGARPHRQASLCLHAGYRALSVRHGCILGVGGRASISLCVRVPLDREGARRARWRRASGRASWSGSRVSAPMQLPARGRAPCVFASRKEECALMSRSSDRYPPAPAEDKEHAAQARDPHRAAVRLASGRGDHPALREGSGTSPPGDPLG